jgi:hypothetical protein
MAVVLALLPAAGHDQLWFLLMAERWLHGAALYGPQAFDSNTPAIVWLSAIPVALAEHLRLPLPFTAKLLMILLETGIAASSLKILDRLPIKLSPAARWFLAFIFVTLFAVVPARDFGQRDLIAALLCLPYILAAAQTSPTPRSRVGTILVAATGICVKPQLAVIPIFVECTTLLLTRKRHFPGAFHAAALLFVAAGALFVVAIHLFAPLYLSQAIPTTYLAYWAIGHLTLTQLLAQSLQLHILLIAVLLLLLPIIRKNPPAATSLRPTILLLVASGIAGTISYYQQGTGWYYQQLPGIVFLGAALSLELLLLSRDQERVVPSWLPTTVAVLSLLSVGLTLHFSGYPLTEDRAYAIVSPDPSFFAGLAPGTPVATLTTSVDDAIEPIFRYRLTWAQRTDNLWTLPAILRATNPTASVAVPRRISPRAVAELTAQQRLWMVEDLNRWHPQIILIARCQSPEVHCQELEDRHDDLLAFFLADPAFRSLWQHYRPLRSAGAYDAYALASPY